MNKHVMDMTDLIEEITRTITYGSIPDPYRRLMYVLRKLEITSAKKFSYTGTLTTVDLEDSMREAAYAGLLGKEER